MSFSPQAFIEAARSREGKPFRHHFKPDNNCNYGSLTTDLCMDNGMDDRGYDCSGLVIASLCDILDLDNADWPREYRHVKQLEELVEPGSPEPGDLLVYHSSDPESEDRHISISVVDPVIIHASGSRDTKRVVEGVMTGLKMSPEAQVIPFDRILEIARS